MLQNFPHYSHSSVYRKQQLSTEISGRSLMEYHVKGPDDVSGVSQVYKHLLCYNGLDFCWCTDQWESCPKLSWPGSIDQSVGRSYSEVCQTREDPYWSHHLPCTVDAVAWLTQVDNVSEHSLAPSIDILKMFPSLIVDMALLSTYQLMDGVELQCDDLLLWTGVMSKGCKSVPVATWMIHILKTFCWAYGPHRK